MQKHPKTNGRYKEVNEPTQRDRSTYPIEVRRGWLFESKGGGLNQFVVPRKVSWIMWLLAGDMEEESYLKKRGDWLEE